MYAYIYVFTNVCTRERERLMAMFGDLGIGCMYAYIYVCRREINLHDWGLGNE